MSVECIISNYTFPFTKIENINIENIENDIIAGKYIFETQSNPIKVLLSNYTLKGTKHVLQVLADKFNNKNLYVIGITYMNKETLEPIDTQIGITGKLKFGENHLEGAERELIEEFGSYLNYSNPIGISDNNNIKIFGFDSTQCFPINDIKIINDKIKNNNKDIKSKKVGTIIAGELKDLINIIMNIRFKLNIEKDIYGIKLLSVKDILNIPLTELIIN